MYTDGVLFVLGGCFVAFAILFGFYLVVSRKRSKAYRTVLRQETELFDVLTTTAIQNQTSKRSASIDKESASAVDRKTTSNQSTKLLDDMKTTVLLNGNRSDTNILDFDATALEGRYILEEEIHGGGMSRVFLARSAKLDNLWIIKYISSQNGVLANEENILKLLNHNSLPRIIDIFKDEKGIYLVESFIEGVTLDKVVASGQKINQVILLDWAEQLAQALSYLHQLSPHPIFHFDMKPSNVMVTHDNRLVLIDFGISKRQGEDNVELTGVTYNYAAPEQLNHQVPEKYLPVISNRFGTLPEAQIHWNADARTDIYGLGVILFELASGQIPTIRNKNALMALVSKELAEIIGKCMATNPTERYQTAKDLLSDLQKSKGSKMKMVRTLFMRKFAATGAAFSIILSGGSFYGGNYIYQMENLSILGVDPEIVTISQQQSSEMKIEKQMPDGKVVLLDSTQIRWSFTTDSIAKVDGNRIAGMNIGETELNGIYRNKSITLKVNVVEPMDGMVEISQRYQAGHFMDLFAGKSEREHVDGTLANAGFVSPESIALSDDGTIYVTDAGKLRSIKDGNVGSIDFQPGYLTSRIVRCHKNEVYILTHEWEDENGMNYGIIRLKENKAEGLYIADAKFTAIEDFSISSDGLIYFIDRNEGVGAVYLKTLDPGNTENIQTLCELPTGTSALTLDEKGTVYLANPITGVIQEYKNGALTFFAGVENQRAFIDGTLPEFYEPQRLHYANGMLYVWDFNVLRRITIS